MLHWAEPELVQRTREVVIPHARRLFQPIELAKQAIHWLILVFVTVA